MHDYMVPMDPLYVHPGCVVFCITIPKNVFCVSMKDMRLCLYIAGPYGTIHMPQVGFEPPFVERNNLLNEKVDTLTS